MNPPGEEQFQRQVYPSELKAIRARREVWGLDAGGLPEPAAGEPIAPDPAHGTAGLAFSGGGIRSATFNLGVLQVLAKRGLLAGFDYLSTVSGGGYIGSNLSCALQCEDPSRQQPGYSYIHERGQEESALLQHLRSGRDYLAPDGLLDLLKIPAVLFRGMVLNLLVLFPFLALFACLTAWLYPHLLDPAWRAVLPGFELLLSAPETAAGGPGGRLHFFLLFPWTVVAFGLWIVLFPLVATLASRAGYRWRSLYETSYSALLLLMIAVPAVEAAPWLLRRINARLDASAMDELLVAIVVGLLALVVLLSSVMGVRPGASRTVARLAGRLRELVAAVLGPAILLCAFLRLTRALYAPDEGGGPLIAHPPRIWLMLIVAGTVFLYTRFFLDINKSGMHRFYRDRLSKAYLMDPRDGVHEDELCLSALDVTRSGAPYHLLNTALNVEGAADRALQGRGADFFVFSPGWIGSFSTGYCPTPALETENRDLNLGTALAISGAAASPYMGAASSRLRALALTLLNIRLDYWFANPARIARHPMVRAVRRFVFRVGPLYLLAEVLGLIDADSPNVNLSDGGHIENLGLYELLRRRCRTIVVGDAGQDPLLELSSLGQLTAYARMDEGIQIEWTGLEHIALRADGTSAAQWAVGRIRYGDSAEEGRILYIKACLHGDEPADIRAYRAQHASFPHESSTNQFFAPNQFEAYRALGYHIADKAVTAGGGEGKSAGEWVEGMALRA
jgi:hypothetical protein